MALNAEQLVQAACRHDPDALFVQGAEQNAAKRICGGCAIRNECLVEALDNRIEYGVWGGRTERERRAILRRHPGVTSWARVLESVIRGQGQPAPSGRSS
jgi:WhiB family redox-sensing transcriptional regulator